MGNQMAIDVEFTQVQAHLKYIYCIGVTKIKELRKSLGQDVFYSIILTTAYMDTGVMTHNYMGSIVALFDK